jgi:hypothetical protein
LRSPRGRSSAASSRIDSACADSDRPLRFASRSMAPRTFGLTRTSMATLPVGLRPDPARLPPRAMLLSCLIDDTLMYRQRFISVAPGGTLRQEEGRRKRREGRMSESGRAGGTAEVYDLAQEAARRRTRASAVPDRHGAALTRRLPLRLLLQAKAAGVIAAAPASDAPR